MIDKLNKTESGVAAILALLVLSSVLAIALSVSSIMISQLKFARTAGHSVPAFFAADAGIEKILNFARNEDPDNNPQNFTLCVDETTACPLSNEAKFWVEVTPTGTGGCAADTYCIKSTGEFKETRRAIEVNY